MLRNHSPLFPPQSLRTTQRAQLADKSNTLQHLLGEDRTLVNLLLEGTDPLMKETRCPLMDSRIVPMMSG